MNTDEHRLLRTSERYPPNLDPRVAEIDQQAEPQASCLEVVEALSQVNIIYDASMLEFHEDTEFDEKIGYIFADDDAIVSDGDRMLLCYGEASFAQFVRASVFVDLFKEPAAKAIAHSKCAADDLLRYLIWISRVCTHLSSSVFICG